MSTASPATGGHPLVFHEANDVRAFSREQRKQGKSIGFVPTMVRHVRNTSETARRLWASLFFGTADGALRRGVVLQGE